ncbi:MAG: hypothetical protein ACFFDK_02145 [Promethearchaeota archaeon]
MLLNQIIATTSEEVGVSWFDFYSIGHICFGIGLFLFFSLFYSIPKARGDTPIFSLLLVFILTFIILVLWEVFENTWFIPLGWKFENRLDSPQNIFTDLVFGVIGSLGSWIFAYISFEKEKKHWPYYVFGIISFVIWLGIFIILRYLTFMNSPII